MVGSISEFPLLSRTLLTDRRALFMNYRNFSDLAATIRKQAHIIPTDVDLIVGVPRSGIIPASMIATIRGLPLTDLDSYIAGTVYKSGIKFSGNVDANFSKILIVDDSVATGAENQRIRSRLRSHCHIHPGINCLFAAIYVLPGSEQMVDLWFEQVPGPRLFEWNLLSSSLLQYACVDIDGVLCRDPTEEENDDGQKYIDFLLGAEPLYSPKKKIGWLVTSRLEKYRMQTETWLHAHGIEYGELRMLDLPDKATRQRLNAHGTFKSFVYSRTNSAIFIESSTRQARDIAKQAGKPVICTEDSQMYMPGSLDTHIAKVRRAPHTLSTRIKQAIGISV